MMFTKLYKTINQFEKRLNYVEELLSTNQHTKIKEKLTELIGKHVDVVWVGLNYLKYDSKLTLVHFSVYNNDIILLFKNRQNNIVEVNYNEVRNIKLK